MEYLEKLKFIKNNLEKCPRVTRYTSNVENQADTLANSYIDLEESMKKIINTLIPRLYSEDLSADEVDNLVLEIGEEFRHVIYHINDTKVYGYLKDMI